MYATTIHTGGTCSAVPRVACPCLSARPSSPSRQQPLPLAAELESCCPLLWKEGAPKRDDRRAYGKCLLGPLQSTMWESIMKHRTERTLIAGDCNVPTTATSGCQERRAHNQQISTIGSSIRMLVSSTDWMHMRAVQRCICNGWGFTSAGSIVFVMSGVFRRCC